MIKLQDISMAQLLEWADTQNTCLYLNPNGFDYPEGAFRHLMAVGTNAVFTDASYTLKEIQEHNINNNTWLFGGICYDYKNVLENLQSNHTDQIGFPNLFMFEPAYVFEMVANEIFLLKGDMDTLPELMQQTIRRPVLHIKPDFTARLGRQDYIEAVNILKAHILKGDIYEINFCQEFYAENAKINPLTTYNKLNAVSPAPFSAYLKWDGKYMMCASPERFLKKEGVKLISQPIKGTRRRGADAQEDQSLKTELFNDPKERAENVMIVDLVRNDLSTHCIPGTVQVEELFGIYTFPQVHQMISTIAGVLENAQQGLEALGACFPMGSMTGAPKLRAMELTEKYESTYRGLYSGTVGYITPDGDFDFNVVIRSLLYNAEKQYLSFETGGAITYQATAEDEYEESLLKGTGILKAME